MNETVLVSVPDEGLGLAPPPSGRPQSVRMSLAHDDQRLATSYDPGNAMPENALRAWAELIGSYAVRPTSTATAEPTAPAAAAEPTALAVIEVGAGTGMFSAAIARWIAGASVLAVDPSEAMLAEARRYHPHPAVRYVSGSAQSLPAPDDAFDLALLSRVIHHLPDRPAAARELARVLRPGATAVIRTTFRERLDALVYDYWPPLRAVDAVRFPGEEEVVAEFAAAGFALRTSTSFAQPVTRSLREYHARMVSRPQSKFGHLTTEEFHEGLERLAHAAANEPPDRPVPVVERYDVAVFDLR